MSRCLPSVKLYWILITSPMNLEYRVDQRFRLQELCQSRLRQFIEYQVAIASLMIDDSLSIRYRSCPQQFLEYRITITPPIICWVLSWSDQRFHSQDCCWVSDVDWSRLRWFLEYQVDPLRLQLFSACDHKLVEYQIPIASMIRYISATDRISNSLSINCISNHLFHS